MEGYEYPYYGMEDGSSSTSSKHESSSGEQASQQPPAAENVPVTAVLAGFDPGRLCELEATSHDLTERKVSGSSSRFGQESLPIVAYRDDSGRVSIHPLGNFEIPAGVSPARWNSMDADSLFPKKRKVARKKNAVPEAIPEETSIEPRSVKTVAVEKKGQEVVKEEHDPTEMPFLDHLEEFRWALLKSLFAIAAGMIAAWFLSDMFYSTVTRLAKEAEIPLIATKLMEPIMLKLQMAFVMGIVLSFPFVLYYIWSFVSPGLYRSEKKWILPLVFTATFLFLVGASLSYFLVLPYMLKFVKNFLPADITQMVTIGDFVGKLLKFTVLFGVIFQLPLLSYILAKIGIIKYTLMKRYRRYAIVSIFIIAAILTPPDPYSQIVLAIPLLVLYEVSILVARIAGRKTVLQSLSG